MAAEMEQGGYRMLREWTLRHRVSAPVAVRLAQPAPPAGYRLGPLEPMEPHRALPERGLLEDASCLEWRLGHSVTDLE
jgi:hypothetical protein